MDKLLESLRKEKIHISLIENDLKIKFNGTKLPDHILQAIKSNKEALKSYLRANQNAKTKLEIAKIQESDQGYPLSSSQSRLWVTCQIDEASLAYNMSFSARLNIKDKSKFIQAINAVVDRHEVLRTVFAENENGELRQWILKREELGTFLTTIDLRKEKEAEVLAKNYVSEDARKQFDLEKGPLLRALLIQLSEDEFLFYYNMHHIICDGWSLNVLSQDVMRYYEASMLNKTEAFDPLKIQYKDYASWQINRMEQEDFAASKLFWNAKLEGELPKISLPSTLKRPKVKTFNGKSIGITFPRALTTDLHKFIKENGGSLYVVLVSALKTLMHKYSGEEDIILGAPVSGRNNVLLEDQIGFYLNLLILKSHVNPKENYKQFYSRIRSEMIASFEHQDYPFDMLLNEIDVERDPGRSPIFDILIDYHGVSEAIHSVEKEGLVNQKEILVKYDLEFHFYEVEDTIQMLLNFNTDIYEQSVMENLGIHFLNFLKQIELKSPIGEIDLKTAKEKGQLKLLEHGSDSSLAYPNLIENFYAQTLKTPQAVALEYGDTSMNYEELEALSNQIAYGLIHEYKIKPNDVVALHFETNHLTVASILGVLKTGASYLFLDTTMPVERKYFILKNSSANLVITETDYLFDLTDYEGALFSIDVEFNAEWNKDHLNLIDEAGIAYIIYTSGSTGVPKGVRIGHVALMNYLLWAKGFYSDNKMIELNFGLFTTLAFDLTVTSLFLPLISGNRLKVIEKNEVSRMIQDYIGSDLNCIKLTPAHINVLANFTTDQTVLNTVIVGGDVLLPQQVEILRRINPDMHIYNEYGPTETTVGCTVYKLSTQQYENIPIGKPIDNTRVQILNESLQPQPIGLTGEIYLSGKGLAEGYHGLNELNAERFIKRENQECIYKTGDLGRWLPNGELAYIGRIDNQVKLRGYRIEINEIISNLLKKQTIQEAAVLLKEMPTKEKELVAYIVSEEKENISDIRSFLSDKLPLYMIPGYFVQLEKLPLTNNGKIDTQKLISIEKDALASGVEYLAPSDELEFKLVAIWEEILLREKIGMNDDFFVLGGNSLLAIKLVNAYQRAFNIKVSLTDVFAKSLIKDHVEFFSQDVNQKEEHIETFEF